LQFLEKEPIINVENMKQVSYQMLVPVMGDIEVSDDTELGEIREKIFEDADDFLKYPRWMRGAVIEECTENALVD
jgi:hypothetical protein